MEAYTTLLELASADVGLDDFGDPSFREGLELLTKSLKTEARLSPLGERVFRDRILKHLKQRLQVEDWYRRQPEIDDEVIRAPLIGLGLPRTGSSALSYLLAQDPNTRSLRTWEASEPCPPPSTVKGPDPRRGGPPVPGVAWKAHTPTSADGPIECQDLMGLDFKAHIFQALAYIPSYSRWLMDADLTSTYQYERRVLKLLQWGYPAKPWRLKAPTHILYLDHLVRAFPDARFVMTHRDPVTVLLSVASVYQDMIGKFTDEVDSHYVGALNLENWSLGMRRVMAFRDQGGDSKFFDIDFRMMNSDPIGQVKTLYAWLGEEVTPDFEQGMRTWWQSNLETREPNVVATADVFGLDEKNIRQTFAEYIARAEVWTQPQGRR